jgi:hypothetical protein
MAFNPQDYDVKPIGAAGLTERTSLDGSERILVQAGADADVDTTPMQFFKYQVIKSKIDEIKEDISNLELSLEGVNTSLSSSVSGLNAAVGEIEGTLDSVQGSVSGVEMMNINAREADTYSIGTISRFLNIAGKNIYCDKLVLPQGQHALGVWSIQAQPVTVKKDTWARIVEFRGNDSVRGCSFIVHINGTRASVVWNSTWLVSYSHNKHGNLSQLGASTYTNTRIRTCVDINSGGIWSFTITENLLRRIKLYMFLF